jgi:hypothetical protein
MLALCYLCPPLAILLTGRPLLAFVSIFTLNPLVLVLSGLLLALGCPPAPVLLILLVLGPLRCRASKIALEAVNNKYQDRRFNKLGRWMRREPREKRLPPREPEPNDDPTMGMGGTRFRRRT